VESVLLAILVAQFGMRALPAAWQKLNTDFPNYYVTASLAREHFDTSRVYEWIWIQRERDYRDIDQRVIGMVPLTVFSSLFVYPLTPLPALTAKHCWIVFNIALLLGILGLLRAMTGLEWRRIALVIALSFPVRVNLLYGQFYVLLLFFLTLACFFYLRQRSFASGLAIGVAAGLKVFPVLFLLYFLRKRDLKAFSGGLVAGLCSLIASVCVFGWQVHRVYIFQILPRTLRGEGSDPYNLKAASLSTLMHRLFIYEPTLNPHPAINAAWLFGVLHPLLQMAVIAPALLLAVPHELRLRRIRLEWAAMLLAILAITTSAASYQFTVLILPACLLLGTLPQKRPRVFYGVVLVLYAAAGALAGTNVGHEGWAALLAVPRLYLLLAFCVIAYAQLEWQPASETVRADRFKWGIALSLLLAFSIATNLRQLRGLYDDYRWRAVAPANAYMTVDPAPQGDAVHFISMMGDGYHSGIEAQGAVRFSDWSNADRLSLTAADNGEAWVEEAKGSSVLIPVSSSSGGASVSAKIFDAKDPVASYDGKRLAFVREDHGRGRIWIHAVDAPQSADMPITPPELNALEMSFLTRDGLGGMIFSAASDGRPSLFTVDQGGKVQPFSTEEARYPAVSPDGNWLAYSQLHGGHWNLQLRELGSGKTRELAHAACNTMEPAWAADSKTLFYASDCGRALWFPVICKQLVIP
jgi:Glycosyltransferase family 87/WD40-like Beta Propeller Repeat